MPALIRTLAFSGAVFSLLFSLSAVPAHAQMSQDMTLPAVAPAAPPATAAPSEPAATTITAPLGTDSSTTTTPTQTTHHKVTHHKKKSAVHHKTTVHHSSKKHKSSKKVKKASNGDPKVREIQTHLVNLGYYKGKVDGLNGPQTRAAIKKFQHDNKLKVTGKLDKATYDAIIQADKEKAMSSLPPIVEATKEAPPKVIVASPNLPEEEPAPNPGPDFYATHPDFYGHYNQSYENPMLLGPTQTLFSRFAKIDLSEDTTQQDGSKRYNIALNGLPLILVDGQPSVIGVSRTFQIGDEDVIIFTTFKDHDPVCAYEYNLLILSSDGTHSRAINNCTRGYQAKISGDSLFITFPESDDARAVGNTWRYEKGDLEKL